MDELKPSTSVMPGGAPPPSLRDIARDPTLVARMHESLSTVASFLSSRAVLREAPELSIVQRLIDDPTFVADTSLIQYALMHDVPQDGVLALIHRIAIPALFLETVIGTARALEYHFVVEALSPQMVPGGG